MGEDLSNEDECPVWTASVRALSTAQGVPPNAGCERNHESVRLKYYY
jgi:hypothetical protein